MPGVISGVTPEGFYVRGTKFPAEVSYQSRSFLAIATASKRKVTTLKASEAEIDSVWAMELTVRIEEVDLARRALLLSVVTNHTSRGEANTPQRTGGKPLNARVLESKDERGKFKSKFNPAKRQIPQHKETSPLILRKTATTESSVRYSASANSTG